jgi:hypothetical protein
MVMPDMPNLKEVLKTKKPHHPKAGAFLGKYFSGFRFGLDNLLAPIKAIGTDVVAQVRLASGGLDSNTGHIQCIVRAVHTTLGR